MMEDIIVEICILLFYAVLFGYHIPIKIMNGLAGADLYLYKINSKKEFESAVKINKSLSRIERFIYILLCIFTIIMPLMLIWKIPSFFEEKYSYVFLFVVVMGLLIFSYSPELRESFRFWAKYSYKNIELQKKYIRYYRASFYMMMIILICFGLHVLHSNIVSGVIWGLAIIINYVCIFIYEKASIDKSFVATRCKLIGYYIDGKAEAWEKEDVCGLELTEVEGQKDLIIKMKDGGEVTLWNISDAWYEEIEKTLKLPERCEKSESESI